MPFYASGAIRLLFLALLITLLILGKELLVPLTIAVFLTFILRPVSERLENWHFPRSLAVITSIVLALIALAGFVWFLYMQVQTMGDDASQLKNTVGEKINSIQIFIREHYNVTKRDQSKWIDKKIADAVEEGDQYLLTFFSITGTFITNLALIPLYIYFLTMYRSKIKKFISLIANGEHENAMSIIHAISRVAQKYLKGLTIDVLVVATLCSIGFLIIGLKHAILFGLLVAICNIIIPYMGLTLASIFPFLMMLLTQDHLGLAFGAAGICILVQFIDNHFTNPYIVGSSVSINPLTAFIALVASAMIWGIFGMLLCIPITGMIKVVCDHVDVLKPYGYIIGQEKEFGEEVQKNKSKSLKIISGHLKK